MHDAALGLQLAGLVLRMLFESISLKQVGLIIEFSKCWWTQLAVSALSAFLNSTELTTLLGGYQGSVPLLQRSAITKVCSGPLRTTSAGSVILTLYICGYWKMLQIAIFAKTLYGRVWLLWEVSASSRLEIRLTAPENVDGDATTDRLDLTWKAQVNLSRGIARNGWV